MLKNFVLGKIRGTWPDGGIHSSDVTSSGISSLKYPSSWEYSGSTPGQWCDFCFASELHLSGHQGRPQFDLLPWESLRLKLFFWTFNFCTRCWILRDYAVSVRSTECLQLQVQNAQFNSQCWFRLFFGLPDCLADRFGSNVCHVISRNLSVIQPEVKRRIPLYCRNYYNILKYKKFKKKKHFTTFSRRLPV